MQHVLLNANITYKSHIGHLKYYMSLNVHECGYFSDLVQKMTILCSGGPLSALTCCVNVRLLSAIKKISPLIYSQSWVGSWVYTTQAMMTFTLIF